MPRHVPVVAATVEHSCNWRNLRLADPRAGVEDLPVEAYAVADQVNVTGLYFHKVEEHLVCLASQEFEAGVLKIGDSWMNKLQTESVAGGPGAERTAD